MALIDSLAEQVPQLFLGRGIEPDDLDADGEVIEHDTTRSIGIDAHDAGRRGVWCIGEWRHAVSLVELAGRV